ncbi:DUF2332 domain-containing protein [Lysinibacillus halotolerans]
MGMKLSEQFQRFAKYECENSSKLYEVLSYQIAEDAELLDIVTTIPTGQPKPNLLFAIVHYLLFEKDESLKNYYPTFSDHLLPAEEAFLPFKQFVLKHEQSLNELFQTKLVQTNEVRRCAYLYPMLAEIYEEHKQPLALVEIGTSAGLQLGVDQYNYLYNGEISVTNSKTPVIISSENIGTPLPNAIYTTPKVKTRIGVDLNPIDVKDENELRWLQALIWPEHHERRELLKAAANVVTQLDLHLVQGDGIAKLEELCELIPEGEMIVVFHTHVANQIPMEGRQQLVEKLSKISTKRPLYHCYNNMYDPNLHQDYIYDGEIIEKRMMENTDGHARWFNWAK